MGRGRREKPTEDNLKHLLYFSGGILLILVITCIITVTVYKNKLKDSTYSLLTTEQVTGLVPNNQTDTEQASLEIGKTIRGSNKRNKLKSDK